MPSKPLTLMRALVPLAILAAGACGPSAEVRARLAMLDTVSTQKDSLIQELALQARTLTDVTAELTKVQVQNLQVSSESPAAAQRDTMIQKVRYIVSRVNESQAQLKQSQRRIRQLTHLSDSLRSTLEATVANLQQTIEAQMAQVAALTGRLDTLQVENVALKDTVGNMTVRENTVYYVIGTKDELKQKGLIVQEGGGRVLFVLWKTGVTWQPARELDPGQFTAIDKRQITEIPLPHPNGSYRIISRQDPTHLVAKPDADGRLTGASLQIASPEQFWRNSKFLIVVQEKPGASQPGTD